MWRKKTESEKYDEECGKRLMEIQREANKELSDISKPTWSEKGKE
jgi:hypothetical protein